MSAAVRRLENELYADAFTPNVIAKREVPKTAVNFVKKAFRAAKLKLAKYLVEKDILRPYLKYMSESIPVEIKDVDSYRGLVNAYIELWSKKPKIVVNEKIIPGTGPYTKLLYRLKNSKSKLARYLGEKLSNGYKNLTSTLIHEIGHYIQEKTGLADKSLKAGYELGRAWLQRALPDDMKPMADEIAKAYAIEFARPFIEGTNEVFREYVEGKSEEAPTTYNMFKKAAEPVTREYGGIEKLFVSGYKHVKRAFLKFYENLAKLAQPQYATA